MLSRLHCRTFILLIHACSEGEGAEIHMYKFSQMKKSTIWYLGKIQPWAKMDTISILAQGWNFPTYKINQVFLCVYIYMYISVSILAQGWNTFVLTSWKIKNQPFWLKVESSLSTKSTVCIYVYIYIYIYISVFILAQGWNTYVQISFNKKTYPCWLKTEIHMYKLPGK